MPTREPAPPRNAASARIAAALQAEMDRRGITRKDLAEAIERLDGKAPTRMFMSRTLGGRSHLTVPVPSETPNDLLRKITSAIDPENGDALAIRLARLARRTKNDPDPLDELRG